MSAGFKVANEILWGTNVEAARRVLPGRDRP
jgi:hypothetical protein